MIGYAGTGKSAMLGVAHDAWHSAGYEVRGAALSGIAAENLESRSGIASRTIASMERQWAQDRELLTDRSVLVIDEAGMVGTRQMERVLSEAEKRGAKVVLVGDPEQLQAIEAGAAFRSIAERHGSVEIMQVRRQSEEWQREATRDLATGRTGEAVLAYVEAGHVHVAPTREGAREALVGQWDRDRQRNPEASRIILTHTNDEVGELNAAARGKMREAGELGEDVALKVERGERAFAVGDRVMFFRNERSMGVKNGSLGTLRSVSPFSMAVILDDGRSVAFDLKDYADIDHGYAATIHKAQGMTVDRVQVLATPGLDRHGAYVALSRHRAEVDLHYGKDDFADRSKLVRALSRDRSKDMASDYAPEFELKRQPWKDPVIKRDPFAGLRLKTPTIAAPPGPLEVAVQRYGRAAQDILRMKAMGLDPIGMQTQAIARAAGDLDKVRDYGARDLHAAIRKDHDLADEAGKGQTRRAIQAMMAESEIRIDTDLRADRFVNEFQTQTRLLMRMRREGNELGMERAAERIDQFAKSLHRDPELESRLKARSFELGIPVRENASLSHSIQSWLGRSRDRGIEIS